MLRSIKDLYGYRILGKDGDIGWVHDFLFDDHAWTIRYLVVDVGTFLPGRKVLVIPAALGKPQWKTNSFPVKLSKEKIKNSPDLDVDRPVSRQHEAEIHKYFGWGPYWLLGGPHGIDAISTYHPNLKKEKGKILSPAKKEGDPFLRSTKKVTGYRIQATDGDIGHAEEFIADDSHWSIRYMVVDTRNWLPGRKVLVSPFWIENISWEDSKVYVDLSKEKIKESPRYDASAPVNRKYEERLYDYYGRPKYWK
jgi:hypothetical protein